jgi:CIC family chloride channel protein
VTSFFWQELLVRKNWNLTLVTLGKRTQEIFFLILAMVIGALAGVGVLSFLAFIALGQWLIWPGGKHFLEQVTQAPWWFTVLIPLLGGLAIGPIIAFWAPEVRGPGVTEVIESAALRGGYIAPRVTFFKPLSTGVVIATGGSVGREGPVVHIGSAIGSFLAQFFQLSPEKSRICLACGAAAGIAATFNAPVAGTLFAVEIILADLELTYLGHIVIAAVVSSVVARRFWWNFPLIIVPSFVFRHSQEVWLYGLLGILAGLLAVLLIRLVSAIDTLFDKSPVPEWLQPAVGGLLLGLVGLLSPPVLGVGYDSVNLTLAGKFALAGLVLMFIAKFLATIFCLGSKMSGGIFGPSLFLGAVLGAGLASATNLVLPGLHLPPSDYALVGMGAMISSTTLAPVTAILIIIEMTNTHQIVVPLIVSCIVSLLVVKYLHGYSIYESRLLRQGIKIVRGHEVHILQDLKVQDYMTPPIELVHDSTPLSVIVQKAEQSPYPFFIVLDEQDELSGVLTLWDIRKELPGQRDFSRVSARELMTTRVVTVTPEDNFETAFNLLEGKNFSCLPVVLPPEHKKVVGILRREDIMTAYNQRLLKDRMLQLPHQAAKAP